MIDEYENSDDSASFSESSSVYSEDDEQLGIIDDDGKDVESQENVPNPIENASNTRRVTIRKSAVLKCFYKHHPILVILDVSASETMNLRFLCANFDAHGITNGGWCF